MLNQETVVTGFDAKPEKPSEKSSGPLLGLIVTSHWLGEVWIRIRDGSVVLPLSFVHLENRVYLSRGVQVVGAIWRVATRIMAWIWDLIQRTENDRTGLIFGGRAIERSSDTVYSLHRARRAEERGFLGWASKLRSTVCKWFDLKITVTIFSCLTSKLVATIFPV
jgi:hypothetical protein